MINFLSSDFTRVLCCALSNLLEDSVMVIVFQGLAFGTKKDFLLNYFLMTHNWNKVSLKTFFKGWTSPYSVCWKYGTLPISMGKRRKLQPPEISFIESRKYIFSGVIELYSDKTEQQMYTVKIDKKNFFITNKTLYFFWKHFLRHIL